MFNKLAVVTLLLLGTATISLADNRCYSTYHNYSYPRVEYVYVDRPVAVTVPFVVAVPTVSYLWNGGGHNYAPVFNAQPVYGSANIQSTPNTKTDKPAEPKANNNLTTLTDEQIDYLISRIEARLSSKNVGSSDNSKPPAVPKLDVTTILTTKRGSEQKSCADCHTGSTAKKNFKIFSSPGKLNPTTNWAKIWNKSDSGDMPPEAQHNRDAALTDSEVATLRAKMLESH